MLGHELPYLKSEGTTELWIAFAKVLSLFLVTFCIYLCFLFVFLLLCEVINLSNFGLVKIGRGVIVARLS